MSEFTTPHAVHPVTAGAGRPGHRQPGARPGFVLRPVALTLLFIGGAPLLGAFRPAVAQVQASLPGGLQVLQGQASVVTSGTQMTITNSANAVLDWQRFSVGAGNAVRFNQPDASSQVLNRVVGSDPSQILGSLSSNGRVWLLNPHGVLFGRNARVDVAGLVASTHSLGLADWQARRLNLRPADAAGADGATVVNQGEIRTTTGGRVLLIGGAGGVRNEGLIDAPGGQVVLAAGHSVDLIDTGLPHLEIRVDAPRGEALNLGHLAASGGRLDLAAAIVNQHGIVRADSVDGSGGRIVLRASEALNTGALSVTSADGRQGGQVTLDSGPGAARLAGRVSAQGSAAEGGQIRLLGRQVGLLGAASVDASGRTAGGQVWLGGGLQGRDASLPNAQAVFVGAGTRIQADATGPGDGGQVIVWSDAATRVHGTLSARGGPEGGDGGFIETSGGWLDARPASVRTDAPKGRAGAWLLDPNDIRIINAPVSTGGSGLVNMELTPDLIFTTTNDSAVIWTQVIEDALLAGNDVVIQTGSAGTNSQAGNIDMVSATITARPSRPVSLTLVADGNITLDNATIENLGGSLNVRLQAGNNTTSAVNLRDAHITLEGDSAVRIEAGQVVLSLVETGTSIFTGGAVSIYTNRLFIGEGNLIASTAAGDAITLAGPGGTANLASFVNQAGIEALDAPEGRWLVYAGDPADAQNFNAGGLAHDFRQYNAVSGSAVPAADGNGLLFDVAPVLTFSNGALWTQVYDGSTAIRATDDRVLTAGLLPGDSTQPDLNLSIAFADKNVGQNKPIALGATLDPTAVTDADGRPVFGYTGLSQLRGDITPAPVAVSGATAASKVYDAGVTAAISAWNLSGVFGGDQVVALGAGLFADPNVGLVKGVDATATALGGADAGNYTLTQAKAVSLASIAPAPLAYVADPAARAAGEAMTGFTGQVTGFVGGETLQGATKGSVRFDTPATPASPPGRYAIQGSGLTAANYTFVQAPANATALAVTPMAAVFQPALPAQPVVPTKPPLAPAAARTLDVLQGLRTDGAGSRAFESLDLAAMSHDALAAVLEARHRYKQSLLAEATRQLEADPDLADAPACVTARQVDTGTCLVTEALKAEVRTSLELAAGAPPGGAMPAAAPASPGAAASASAGTSTGTTVGASVGSAASPPPAQAVPDGGPAGRTVRHASLPQIQRKVAVVIGIDNYTDRRIPGLRSARADAEAVANVLSGSLGYETALIFDGTRESILRRLNRLVTQVGPSDSVVIYYAGHGDLVEKTGLGYWLPANADPERPQTWISNNDIGKVLSRISASQVALISDSCFSGSLLSDERIRAGGQSSDAGALLKRRAAVVMSSGGNEPVADTGKNGHSSFSWNLMRALEKVSTWRPGNNVFEQVRFAVARELPQRPRYGAVRLGGHEPGADYVFEQRQFEGDGAAAPVR